MKSVNQKSGPRVGNQGRAGKRGELAARRAEGAALAGVIERAYGARQAADYADKTFPKSGSIEPDVRPRRMKR